MPEISFSFVDYADSVNSEIRPGKKHFSSPRKLMNSHCFKSAFS